jgi:uncharacterized membrane protein
LVRKKKGKRIQETEEDDEAFWMKPNRIEALSDGVIAIAITLLALELSIPHLSGSGDAPSSLLDMGNELYTYAVGFMSLGVYWMLQHYILHFIKRMDGIMLWLNIIFLSFASLVPFWTAFINENPDENIAGIYFVIAMACTHISLLCIWIYGTWNKRLVSENFDMRLSKKFTVMILIGMVLYITPIIIDQFIDKVGYFLFLGAAWYIYHTAWGYKKYLKDKKGG